MHASSYLKVVIFDYFLHALRVSDDVVAVARLCAASGIPHMINNAYGIQSASICKDITAAWRKGEPFLCVFVATFLLHSSPDVKQGCSPTFSSPIVYIKNDLFE
jgi:hypothetical protein